MSSTTLRTVNAHTGHTECRRCALLLVQPLVCRFVPARFRATTVTTHFVLHARLTSHSHRHFDSLAKAACEQAPGGAWSGSSTGSMTSLGEGVTGVEGSSGPPPLAESRLVSLKGTPDSLLYTGWAALFFFLLLLSVMQPAATAATESLVKTSLLKRLHEMLWR